MAEQHHGGDADTALEGLALYGDDFTGAELDLWYVDEREGYFDLYPPESAGPSTYGYSEVARQHGYRWLPPLQNAEILGVGCADGGELAPLLPFARSITVLEPSEGFARAQIAGKPATYVKPVSTGLMPFGDESFDVLVAFSVLHHVPNVSTVVHEMYRVLKRGGYALLREPTVSMGDWRQPRRGLTKRERGLPQGIFRSIVLGAGFEIVRETSCMFSPLSRLALVLKDSVWTYPALVMLDRLICALPFWSRRYHPTHVWHKIRPVSVAFVLRKP